ADIDLTAIAAATLVVSGDLDIDHFRAIARHLVNHIETARLVTLPWAAHLPSLERPSEVSSLIARFVAELAPLS
ncbi:MAG: alpha/beta hydrolase, partial [Actinomycetota bacterium]|nr:alpha/beta hydrolase [Actinomycetota bacterium]